MFNETPTFSSYSVNDIDAARAFYGETLGLAVTQTKEGLDLKLKGCAVFIYPKPNHVAATFTVLNFVVDNIDTAVEELKSKGIKIENYDMGGVEADEKGIYRGRAAGMGPDIAWFKDPAGNVLSVIQEK